MADSFDVTARNGTVELAGTVWLPPGTARGLLVMHPGSGPSDRHNDVLFPPIRTAFLRRGLAVCSFDKRGVGGSSGSWLEASISDQAADLVSSLAAAREVVSGVPVGLFGHSQGGWVVIEAAQDANADFVITNSGPAVTPRVQEAYSTGSQLRAHGWDEARTEAGVTAFLQLMDQVTARTFAAGRAWMQRSENVEMMAALRDAGIFVPETEEVWIFAGSIMDHDPVPALRRLGVPLLAVLGEADRVVPVEASAQAYRSAVRPELLELHLVPGGDHRLQTGDDRTFADGYLAALTTFVRAHV